MKNSLLLLALCCIGFISCKNKGCTDEDAINYNAEAEKDDGSCEFDTTVVAPPITASSEVLGYSIMDKLPGIWNGPVTSPTYLGSYPEWIVDFRPISPAQISAKNELDTLNDIFMSFFVVEHDGGYKIAFRNGGGFAGDVRTSYMFCDSVSEGTESYYRFVDAAVGQNRCYTEVVFKADSLIMTTYTNQYQTLQTPAFHMQWTADLRDGTSSADAVANFSYPQKQEVQDFSTSFDGLTEAVFYGNIGDPYPESAQPYLGQSTLNITVSNPATVNTSKKILVIITTQPLFSGMTFLPQNLEYRSRYVFVNAAQMTDFEFNYMHPGSYYVNCIYDENGDYNFSSGDFMNGSLDVPLSLSAESTASCNVDINFPIP